MEVIGNMNINNMTAGYCLMYKGKAMTKVELLAEGFTEEELLEIIRNGKKSQVNYSHLEAGLVLQYFYSGWHDTSVIVRSNERFVWVKSWDDLKDETKKPKRILKKNITLEGYSTKRCQYSSNGSEYIGKIIKL